ncbi:hypothetical protein GCM10023238_16370 [Streptomyces heliomycini]
MTVLVYRPDRGRAADQRRGGQDTADSEGGDGRCTVCGRAIRRGGAVGDDRGARPRAAVVTRAATAPGTAALTAVPAVAAPRTAAADGRTTRRTGGRATRERSGPGGAGERPHPHLHAGRSAAAAARADDTAAGAPAAGRRPGPAAQLVLALVCAAYAVGAAFGWGSERLALIMGDFGLSAAAGVAAVSCFVYARSPRTRSVPPG